MADEIDLGATEANGFDDSGDAPMPQVSILVQYAKDLSFENPNAPMSLQAGGQPKIEVNVAVNAKRAGEGVFEAELKITAKATSEDETTAFMVELVYAGVFGLANVPDEALEPFLIIEAPRILFPFARRIIADATRDGGFPPLMLDPIDFGSLYMAQQANGGNLVGNA